jgi:hypothetical protein
MTERCRVHGLYMMWGAGLARLHSTSLLSIFTKTSISRLRISAISDWISVDIFGFAVGIMSVSYSTTSDKTAMIPSIYHNNASKRLNSIKVIQDNAWFVLLELVICVISLSFMTVLASKPYHAGLVNIFLACLVLITTPTYFLQTSTDQTLHTRRHASFEAGVPYPL